MSSTPEIISYFQNGLIHRPFLLRANGVDLRSPLNKPKGVNHQPHGEKCTHAGVDQVGHDILRSVLWIKVLSLRPSILSLMLLGHGHLSWMWYSLTSSSCVHLKITMKDQDIVGEALASVLPQNDRSWPFVPHLLKLNLVLLIPLLSSAVAGYDGKLIHYDCVLLEPVTNFQCTRLFNERLTVDWRMEDLLRQSIRINPRGDECCSVYR